jgi:acyl-CoA synthetase (AMP-forming)/AMP-acid ligase II
MSSTSGLVNLLDSAAAKSGSRETVVDVRRTWTAAELLARSDLLARCLEAEGVRAGERVLIGGRNSGDLVARLFAVWRLGGVAVPIHAELSVERLSRIAANASPAVYLADGVNGDVGALPAESAVIVSSAESGSLSVVRPRSKSDEHADDRCPAALIMYTSGSTSAPLGVVCPEAAVQFALGALHESLGYANHDRVLCVLPLAFDYGLYQVLMALKGRAVLVLEDGLGKPFRLPRVLAQQKVSILPGLPSIFGPLLRAGWLSPTEHHSLRMLTSAGESFPPAMVDALRARLPGARVVPMYGLTECKRVSIQEPDAPRTACYSVGRPLPGTQAWVGDADGQPKPAGEPGELFVQGPHLMAGYWQAPSATGARYIEIAGKRTLRTGDVFRMDSDGYLTFIRREGGFLKVSGERISPAEVEACLVELEEVREAVAVNFSSVEGEERLAVFLTGAPISQLRVQQHCARNLKRVAVPSLVHSTAKPLPRDPNGKYDRHKLAKLAQELSREKEREQK